MSRFFRLNSIRDRIQGGFLLLTLLIVVLVIFSAIVLNRTRKIAAIHSDVNELQVYSLNLLKTDNDFFNVEIYNQGYLRTRHSKLIQKRDSLNQLIQERIDRIVLKSKDLDYPITHYLVRIDTLLSDYQKTFTALEELYFSRGFKDEGIEGAMRSYAHQLEQPSVQFEMLDLLSLRRSEKDFLIRHDTVYIENFNRQVSTLLSQSEKRYTPDILAKLKSYHDLFIQLATIQRKIGLSATEGLQGKLGKLTEEMSESYFILAHDSKRISSEAQRDARLFLVGVTLFSILFSILTGYWISKRISEPIARLSNVMESATEKRYRIPEFNLNNAAIEINVLTASFTKLMYETTHQLKELKKKSRQLKRRNEDLKKLNIELDSFLYSTAHDLRSPLSSLQGVLNLMLRENKQSELVVYIEMMRKEITRQETFISQIVEFTKNKRMDISPELLDLKQIIEGILDSLHYVESASTIKRELIIRGNYPFYSDRNRINIIFNNLISNAIRYADRNKETPYIIIHIEILPDHITIQFSDNGIGIERQHLGKIFDMFYRANHDSKGSGLGLFIFSETIHKLNGLVTVESEINLGTSFFIKLPNSVPAHQMALELNERQITTRINL